MLIVTDEMKKGPEENEKNVPIAISVKDVVISYRMLRKMSIQRSILSFAGKDKTPNRFVAVKGVSFDVPQGEIVGLIGKNGSGKSTTLRAIAGILSPDSGSIDLHGNTISLLSIGVGFKPMLTGRENIILSGMLLGFSEKLQKWKIVVHKHIWEFFTKKGKVLLWIRRRQPNGSRKH